MLLLIFAPQPVGANPEYINFSVVLSDLFPQLNAAGANDLVFWSQAELFNYFDEAAQRLSRQAGVFVVRDTSIAAVQGQGPYALPAAQVSTIQVDLNGFVLRPANVQEIEAFDSNWPQTQASANVPVSKFLQDTAGVNYLVLYPTPDVTRAGQKVGIVMHTFPPTISASNVFLNAPTVLSDYFKFYALGEARAKECKGAMPEMAQWFRHVTGLYEQVIEQYWGEAQ